MSSFTAVIELSVLCHQTVQQWWANSVDQNVIIQANHVNYSSWNGKLSENYAESPKMIVPADILNCYLLIAENPTTTTASTISSPVIQIWHVVYHFQRFWGQGMLWKH